MKKLYSILAVVAMTTVATAQTQSMNAFNGADFEDWNAFTGSLSSHGIKTYATQGIGKGVNGSNSLSIVATPTGNDFVFTTKAPEGIPAKIESISFMVKGKAAKSLSLNVYKSTTGFYAFNVEDLTEDKILEVAKNNQYAGTIDTQGKWVKVTLNLSDKPDYNTDTAANLFALKVGRSVAYDIDIDNIVINYEGNLSVATFAKEKPVFVKNTLVNDNTLSFANGGEVKIFNQNGQVVKSAKVEANSTLDISSLSTGVYIVVGVVNGEKISQKIIKK